MTGEASFALQSGIYGALVTAFASSPTLLSGQGVYDDLPQNVGFPYVVIGDGDVNDWGNKTSKGQEHEFLVHTWSRYQGFKELKQIMQVVYDTLHEQESGITVAGQNVVLIHNTFTTHIRDDDGTTRHGIQRFRVLTEEA